MCIELGTAKAQPAAEYALELLPGCEKLLFFAHHKVPPPPPAPVAPICTCLHPSEHPARSAPACTLCR